LQPRKDPALLRSPFIHFLVLGSLLYLAQRLLAPAISPDELASLRIEISADRLAELETSFTEQTGRRPEVAEVERMIGAEVDEEIFFREAVALGLLERDSGVQTRLIQKMLFIEGQTQIDDAPALLARAVELDLHREDIVVRRILVHKMKLIGSALGKTQIPTEAEIRTTYESRQESLRSPDRLSLTHVFLSADRRGQKTRDDALKLRPDLIASQWPPSQATSRGDPFPLGHRLERRSQLDLERTFGERFGEETFDLAIERWSEPIASAYGFHLVFVDRINAGFVPQFSQVVDRLRLEIEETRRNENLDALVNDLRTRYQVVLPTSSSATLNPSPAPDLHPTASFSPSSTLSLNQEPG
jgi:peptidyl-prolyl cis-trans isomerase C